MNTFSFDGFGINDSDSYRSRLATLTTHGKEANVGPLLAAAPDLLEALKIAAMALDLAGLVQGNDYWQQQGRAAAKISRAAIAKATQQGE